MEFSDLFFNKFTFISCWTVNSHSHVNENYLLHLYSKKNPRGCRRPVLHHPGFFAPCRVQCLLTPLQWTSRASDPVRLGLARGFGARWICVVLASAWRYYILEETSLNSGHRYLWKRTIRHSKGGETPFEGEERRKGTTHGGRAGCHSERGKGKPRLQGRRGMTRTTRGRVM